MSVTTSERLDRETFDRTVGGEYTFSGGVFSRAEEKTFTGVNGTTDQQLQSAITAAAAALLSAEANLATIVQQAKDAYQANKTYLQHQAIPAGTLTAAQLSAIVRMLSDQVDALTRQNDALIRLAVGDLTGTDTP